MLHPSMTNPFDAEREPDRHYIWQRLVAVDSDAFVLGDWSMIERDFDADHFEGIRAYGSGNPDDWRVAFADLASYRDNWLEASRQFQKKEFAGMSRREAVYRRTRLTEIEIVGGRALCHKKFSRRPAAGRRHHAVRLAADALPASQAGRVWKIVGFIGYLPLT